MHPAHLSFIFTSQSPKTNLMPSTTEKLHRLEALLRERNAPVLAHFNPGLPREEVIAFLQTHNIPARPELVALYEWHNGVKTVYDQPDNVLYLFPFGCFFNLGEMIQMRAVFNDLVESFREWEEDSFEHPDNYIPVLGTGESDMFLLHLSSGEVLDYQPMIQIFGAPMFRSIDSMLDCLIECYETGVFTIDPEQGLESDFNRYWEIKDRYLGIEKKG